MRKVAVLDDDATISYIEAGKGPALVLLHGIGSAAVSWRHQLAELSDRFRVIAWDAPGYGQSTPVGKASPQTQDYAARLVGLLDERSVERCHLVGHSLGSLIAARFAADHPERILSLTLASIATGHARLAEMERRRLRDGRIDALTKLGPRGMAETRGPRLLSDGASEEARRAVIDTMASIRPEGYIEAVNLLSGGDTIADIARLGPDMPVQIVFGSADVITSPEQNLQAAAALPSARVRRIEGAGHAVYLERPADFNSLLTELQGPERKERSPANLDRAISGVSA